ncbi:MAG: hypothetical protein ACFCUH_10395 [Flavobacteriales bacterium]
MFAFQFAEGEVLQSSFDRRQRQSDIYKAVSLGNVFAKPVTVWIEGAQSCIRLTLRATAVSNRLLFLEEGLVVPIQSICHIRLN